MADVLQRQQRLAHLRYHGFRLGQLARRPEVENAVDAVHVVLAGLVELLQDIEEVEPLPRGEVVVAVGRGGLHQAIFGIETADPLVGVGPVIAPIPVHPDVVGRRPPARSISVVGKPAGQIPRFLAPRVGHRLGEAGDFGELPGIGPLGHGHGQVIEEELQMGRCRFAAEPARDKGARIRHTLGGQIDLHDVLLRRPGQTGPDRGIDHRRPRRRVELPAAQEAHRLALGSAVHDGRRGRARVLRAEAHAARQRVDPAAHRDPQAAGRQAGGRLQFPDRIPGAFERGEGPAVIELCHVNHLRL